MKTSSGSVAGAGARAGEFTGPSVNSLLPVMGAYRATTRIPHGALVEVDPKQGTVRQV